MHTFLWLHASLHASGVCASKQWSGASERPGLSLSLGLNLQRLLVLFHLTLATFSESSKSRIGPSALE